MKTCATVVGGCTQVGGCGTRGGIHMVYTSYTYNVRSELDSHCSLTQDI